MKLVNITDLKSVGQLKRLEGSSPSTPTNLNEMKAKPKEDDCNCGKPLKLDDPRKKALEAKKIIKKRNLLK